LISPLALSTTLNGVIGAVDGTGFTTIVRRGLA